MKKLQKLFKKSHFTLSVLIFLNITPFKIYSQSILLKDYDKNINSKYYNLCKQISNKPYLVQLEKLDKFLKTHPEYENVYHRIFDLFIYNNKIDEALDYFKSLTNVQIYIRNSEWMLGKIYNHQQQPDQAYAYYKNALLTGSVSFSFMNNFYYVFPSKYSQIRNLYIKNMNPNKEDELILTGIESYVKSQFKNALAIFNLLSEISKEHLQITFTMGHCNLFLKNYSRAEFLFQKALKNLQQTENLKLQARLHFNLSVIAKNSKLELEHLKSAYQISKSIDYYYIMQFATQNLGFYYRNINDYNKAKNLFNDAFRIAQLFRRYSDAAKLGYYYGQMLFNLRNFNQAIAAYDTSENFARLSKDPSLLFRFKISKGDIYYYLNQNDLAQRLLQEALEDAQNTNRLRRQLLAKARLAGVLIRQKKYKEARKVYQNYIDYINKDKLHQRESEAYWYYKLAQTYFTEKKYDKAKEYFKQAKASAQKNNQKDYYEWSIMRLAELNEKTGNYTEALNLYAEILEAVKENNPLSELSEIYLGLGNVYRKQKLFIQAINQYLLAAEIIEKTRGNLKIEQFKIGYFRDEHRVYKNLVQCYLSRYLEERKQVFIDSLFYYDQMARSRSLQDLKLEKKLPKESESNSLVYQQYIKTCTNLQKRQRDLRLQTNIHSEDELNTILSQIEADKYSLIEQRLRLSGENDSVKNELIGSTICTLTEAIKSLTKENTGLLLFNISDDKSFVLATNDSSQKIVILKTNPDSIKTLIDSLMTPLHNVKQKSIEQITYRADIGFRLYKLLIEPIENVIELPKKLLVISDGELLNLPFEMLLCLKSQFQEYTPTDIPDYEDFFLLHKYSFSYAPSTSFLRKIPSISNGSLNFLLIANPFQKNALSNLRSDRQSIVPGWQFTPLPNADIEANKILDHVKLIEIIRHENATKSVFFEKAPKHQFIHLAAHGFVDLSFDAFSGIAFATANDSTDNGLLLGYEISDLDLSKCELITLSACETGRGKNVAGEGVLGLPRLFLGAGAKSVLMTLWKVDDKFTSELMPEFYKNLFTKKLSKVEALSQAKLQLMSTKTQDIYYQHPFFWASFCLFGEPRNSEIIHTHDSKKIFVNLLITISILFFVILSIKIIHTKKQQKRLS
jgi:CHAT domain-containing protein/tetratricopeptide (TPR) repeat protein